MAGESTANRAPEAMIATTAPTWLPLRKPAAVTSAPMVETRPADRRSRLRRPEFGSRTVTKKLLAATVDDLQAVEGVGELRARSVREGLSRLAESSILERYV